MAAMWLPVNLKTLIDFCKNQKRQTLGFSSPADLLLYFSLLPIHWNCQGQVYCGFRKSCLLTLPSAESKNKNAGSVCICCVLKFSFYCSHRVTHERQDNMGCNLGVANLLKQHGGCVWQRRWPQLPAVAFPPHLPPADLRRLLLSSHPL